MTKKQFALGIRVSDEERAALIAAAENDGRKVSAMGRKILRGWLQEHGYLPKPPPTTVEPA